MLAVDAPNLGSCCNANALKFWHLRISKVFTKPEYYIGQSVLHKMKVKQGEILHPVTVIGLWWSGNSWTYFIQLPEDHPQFDPDEHQVTELEHWQLEAM
jgi:hypothetical protein